MDTQLNLQRKRGRSMTRRLVTIRTIAEITPIEGADRIECLHIDGWRVVTAKANNFKVGDYCFYFEIDSFLPIRPEFEFLRERCYRSTPHLGEGFHLRTIRLKGVYSQGLVLPVSDFGVIDECANGTTGFVDGTGLIHILKDHTDFSEYFGVKLYEPHIPVHLAGKVKGSFPSFIRKTDQERIQNCFNYYKNSEDLWEMTTKLDGSSMTVYYRDGEVGVCSRNLEIKEEDTENAFWKAAKECNLIEKLKKYGKNIALQGELYGLGVQKNPDNLKTTSFYLFDVWDIYGNSYWSSLKRKEWAKEYDIQEVPSLGYFVFGDFSSNEYEFCGTTVEDVLRLADNAKSISGKQAEGIVFKNIQNPNESFKAISNHYLIKTGG